MSNIAPPIGQRTGKRRPMPTIITPDMGVKRPRRLIDSQLGKRPTSARGITEAKTEITKLKINPIPPEEIKETFIHEPPTSRSASILNYTPKLKDEDPEIALDQILGMIKQWNNESIFEMDFRVYHILTHELFALISKIYENLTKEKTSILFKALAICIRVTPTADRELLDPTTKLIYELSKDEFNDQLFIRCGIIPTLIRNAFADVGEISTYSCASLRHICSTKDCIYEILKTDVIKDVCRALQTRTRRSRFIREKLTFTYQVIGLLVELFNSGEISDYSFINDYELPHNILELCNIYDFDPIIENMIAKALSLLVMHDEALDDFESEDLMPFATLLLSERLEVAEMAALALANAMNQSEIITSNVVFSEPPLNTSGLIGILVNARSKELLLSLIRCLAKASGTQKGSEEIFVQLDKLIPLLDIPLSDVDNWSTEQMVVANMLIILKNLTVNHIDIICDYMKGRMMKLMNYGILDYVVDLMREMMRCPKGWAVCLEVKEVDEIKFMLPALASF